MMVLSPLVSLIRLVMRYSPSEMMTVSESLLMAWMMASESSAMPSPTAPKSLALTVAAWVSVVRQQKEARVEITSAMMRCFGVGMNFPFLSQCFCFCTGPIVPLMVLYAKFS